MKGIENIFIFKDGRFLIDGNLAFVLATTYGFPVEMIEEEVNKILPHGSFERSYAMYRAYDKVKGTKFAERLNNIWPKE